MVAMRYAMLVVISALFAAAPAYAQDATKIAVAIKDHHFAPSEIHVPVGKPTVLRITNQDATPEEFDSSALKVEKVVSGNQTAEVRLRPLGPGRYPFMGEYHSNTAQGVVVAE
jgi:plastocyanin